MSGHLIPKPSVVTVISGGGGGSNTAVENVFLSSGAISGHIAIYAAVGGPVAADPSVVSQQDKILGITKSAAAGAGESVTFVSEGLLTDPSFTFTEGPVYIGAAGALTQTKPTSGLLIQIATAMSATEIIVGASQSVKLA